jgi:hypothetical protein
MIGLCSDCGDIPDFIVTRHFEGLQKMRNTMFLVCKTEIATKREIEVVESVSALTRGQKINNNE